MRNDQEKAEKQQPKRRGDDANERADHLFSPLLRINAITIIETMKIRRKSSDSPRPHPGGLAVDVLGRSDKMKHPMFFSK
jgi:hypothetical protein